MAYGYRRRRYAKRGYKKGYRSARRKYAKASGARGKVGVYMSHLRAKVFVAARKYKVMHEYARLIGKMVLQEHYHTQMDIQIENQAGVLMRKHRYSKHHEIPKGTYKKLIGIIMERMVITNWYSNWYEHRNFDLAKDAKSVLEQHSSHHHFKAPSDSIKTALETIGGVGAVGGLAAFLGMGLL